MLGWYEIERLMNSKVSYGIAMASYPQTLADRVDRLDFMSFITFQAVTVSNVLAGLSSSVGSEDS